MSSAAAVCAARERAAPAGRAFGVDGVDGLEVGDVGEAAQAWGRMQAWAQRGRRRQREGEAGSGGAAAHRIVHFTTSGKEEPPALRIAPMFFITCGGHGGGEPRTAAAAAWPCPAPTPRGNGKSNAASRRAGARPRLLGLRLDSVADHLARLRRVGVRGSGGLFAALWWVRNRRSAGEWGSPTRAFGSRPMHPDTNSMFPARIPCEYGPTAAGASSVFTTFLPASWVTRRLSGQPCPNNGITMTV